MLGAFSLPFLAYALLHQLRGLLSMPKKEWTRDITWTLILFGMISCVALLLAVWLLTERNMGAYHPAHIENGQIVPGHLD
eukprot:gene16687-16867_t